MCSPSLRPQTATITETIAPRGVAPPPHARASRIAAIDVPKVQTTSTQPMLPLSL